MITMPGAAWRAIQDLIDDPAKPDQQQLKGRGYYVIWNDPSSERTARIVAEAEDALLWSADWPNSKSKHRARESLHKWLRQF